MTPKNIRSGFQATDIYPYNADIFYEDDFKRCQVTDCPDPQVVSLATSSDFHVVDATPSNLQVTGARPHNLPVVDQTSSDLQNDFSNGQSSNGHSQNGSIPSSSYIKPADCLGFPKAGPWKTTGGRRGRKKDRSMMMTSISEMKRIKEETAAKLLMLLLNLKRKWNPKFMKKVKQHVSTDEDSILTEKTSSFSFFWGYRVRVVQFARWKR